MTEIVIPAPLLDQLTANLASEKERFAALFLTHVSKSDRYLVIDSVLAGEVDYVSSSETEVTVSADFLMRVTRRARDSRLHLALLHTHPVGYREFSPIDDDVERALKQLMKYRVPNHSLFSMVLCGGQLIARVFAEGHSVPVRSVGRNVQLARSDQTTARDDDRFDRQVRAFGESGQAVLSGLRVSVVGIGGTGSVLVQQLAHLGVQDFLLVDPDVVELTNLNRVVGSNLRSVGHLKVDVASEMIKRINSDARVASIGQTVISKAVQQALVESDCIFLCTDSHSSRAFVSELSYTYLIPTFDMGVSIGVDGGVVKSITGRAQMLSPGLPCLLCANAIDSRAIREELMSPAEREADPYFQGEGVAQPAVISINSTVVSLAVTMFLSAFTGIPATSRWSVYDAVRGVVRNVEGMSQPECPFCGGGGALAMGDARQLGFIT